MQLSDTILLSSKDNSVVEYLPIIPKVLAFFFLKEVKDKTLKDPETQKSLNGYEMYVNQNIHEKPQYIPS